MAASGLPDLDDAGAALGLLLRAHRVLFDAVDGELRDRVGLSFALWEVLLLLAAAPDQRLRMVDITKQMCVSKSNVTQLVDRLEAAGLVAREFSSSDRRLTYARPTPRGAEASRLGWEVFNAAAQAHFSKHVSKAEIKNLVSGLTKVLAAHEPQSVQASASA